MACRLRRCARLTPPSSDAAAGNLFARIRATPAVQSLARRLENGGALSGFGITAAAQPFVAALLRIISPQRPIVLVADHLKTQESFLQDLETWMRLAQIDLQPLFFPAWEMLPHEAKLPHADVISDRLETLISLKHHAPRPREHAPMVVTSVVALLQRTFAP